MPKVEYMMFCPHCGRLALPEYAPKYDGRCTDCFGRLIPRKVLEVSDWNLTIKNPDTKNLCAVMRNQFEKETLPLGFFNKYLSCAQSVYRSIYRDEEGPIKLPDYELPDDYELRDVLKPSTTSTPYTRTIIYEKPLNPYELDAPALLGILTGFALFSNKK